MQSSELKTSVVDGKVEELLPQRGLAFVLDDSLQSWGVSRSTPGNQFDALAVGRRVRLQIQAHRNFSIVREYEVLD